MFIPFENMALVAGRVLWRTDVWSIRVYFGFGCWNYFWAVVGLCGCSGGVMWLQNLRYSSIRLYVWKD